MTYIILLGSPLLFNCEVWSGPRCRISSFANVYLILNCRLKFQIRFSFLDCPQKYFTQLRIESLTIKFLSQNKQFMKSSAANKILQRFASGSRPTGLASGASVEPETGDPGATRMVKLWRPDQLHLGSLSITSPAPSSSHISMRKRSTLYFHWQVIPEELCGMGWPKSRDQVVDHEWMFFVGEEKIQKYNIMMIVIQWLSSYSLIIFFIKGAILGGPGDRPSCVAKSREDPPCIRLP